LALAAGLRPLNLTLVVCRGLEGMRDELSFCPEDTAESSDSDDGEATDPEPDGEATDPEQGVSFFPSAAAAAAAAAAQAAAAATAYAAAVEALEAADDLRRAQARLRCGRRGRQVRGRARWQC
jgi:hypothetical protein